ncbi:MAG: DUF6148 family protein [Gammaproteobacteria bacterium]
MLTLNHAQTQLAAWLQANLDVAEGKSVSLSTPNGARSITREDSAEILRQIQYWQQQIALLSKQSGKPYSLVTFKD